VTTHPPPTSDPDVIVRALPCPQPQAPAPADLDDQAAFRGVPDHDVEIDESHAVARSGILSPVANRDGKCVAPGAGQA